jgi:glycosyltransferase involved in cell wall biosynthesis
LLHPARYILIGKDCLREYDSVIESFSTVRFFMSVEILNKGEATTHVAPKQGRHPVIYVLHCSNLYGTERMALATAQGLADEFETIIIGPPGAALVEAERMGFETREFWTCRDLARVVKPYLKKFKSLTFVGTGPRYNLVCIALNLYYRRRIKQIQIVHGGTGQFKEPALNLKKDYGRKKALNFFDITFATVSDWSKQQLIDFGVRNRIEVIGNFLAPDKINAGSKRGWYSQPGVRNVIIVSRVDHVKRVDLLLDALDRRQSDLSDISFRIFGTGPEFDNLSERARRTHANVEFVGFSDDVFGEMAKADLFLHLCPVEPFGLVVLEAMTVNLASLVPDTGGAASLIEEGVCGFTFHADDADHLAERLLELKNAPADLLNRMVATAVRKVHTDYSPESSLRRYRELFSPA